MAKAKIEDEDIKLALAALDVANDAHWVDGKPNLQMLQEALGPELTVEDVNRVTGGADRIAIARGRGVIMSVPEAPPVNESQVARGAVKNAETKLAEIEVQLGAVSGERQALDRKTDALNAERDRIIRIIQGGNQVSSADAVKAIQEQSMKTAIERKAAIQSASAVMLAAGVKPQFASKLDQDLALRKRDPGHAQRHAAHIAQLAADRNAARG